MFGPSIEQAFPHIAFEQAQLKRKLELQRMLEADQPQLLRSGSPLAAIFDRLTLRLDVRIAGRRSSIIPS